MKRPAAAMSEPEGASAPGSLAVARRTLTEADVVFGGAWLGPGPQGKYEDHPQAKADEAVAAAYAAGIREFDTAPWYGWGTGEERLGPAVAKLGPDSGVRVETKIGRLFAEADGTPAGPGFDAPGRPPLDTRKITNDYTSAGAARSMRESLVRLGLERVHCLRIHDPNDNSCNRGEVEDEVAICTGAAGACAGLRELREKGVIQHVGFGMNCNKDDHLGAPEEILRLITLAPSGTFDSAILAGGWNLLTQTGIPCMLECERRGIEVHVAGVYASGLLVGGTTYAYKEAPKDIADRAKRWGSLAEKFGVPLPAVALAFAALPKCVTRVVIGLTSKEQVEETMATLRASATVPTALFYEARSLGLLSPEVPLPEPE